MGISKIIKILAAILILTSGFVGSYFIVKNSSPAAGEEEKLSQISGKSPAKNPIQWLEKNVLGKVAELGEFNFFDKSTSGSRPENNFTKAFSQMIFEQIKSKNERGLTEKEGKTAISAPNEDFLSKEFLDKFLSGNSSNSSGSYHPKVDQKKFKISQDVSSDNQIQYIKNLMSISQKRFSGFNKTSREVLNEIIEKKNNSSAIHLADIYKTIADDSYLITIPANWVDFHKAFLSHFYSAETMWTAIANFQEDPLRAYLAAQFIPNLESSAKGVQVLIARGMSKNNLELK